MNRKENKKRKKRRLRRKKIKLLMIIITSIILMILVGVLVYQNKNHKIDNINKKIETNQKQDNKTRISTDSVTNKKDDIKEILISAAGDFTLGTDTSFSHYGSFPALVEEYNYDYSHFMHNVYDIFKSDDYTFVNLETTLTDSTEKAKKSGSVVYNFKGSKEYVKILTSGSVEGVTIDNNHSYDYGQQGLDDTINILKQNGVDYCGYGYNIIKEIKGIKIGLLGYSSWYASDELKNKVKSDIQFLKTQNCSIIIPYFHWGTESSFVPNEEQQIMGRYAIDCGADMVLGSHSHVMGTLESYNGKLIVYSLGNFCFGGNSNPSDKRTFILQADFKIKNNTIQEIEYKTVPVLISSVDYRNDYTPTIATGERANEIISKLNEISPSLNGVIRSDYFTIKK